MKVTFHPEEDISRKGKKYEKKENVENGENVELFDTEGDDIKTFAPFERLWHPFFAALAEFIIVQDGIIGTFLRQFGCIMVFLSTFTILYQVNRCVSILK